VPHATFGPADLSVFCRLDELGLVATGQYIEPERAVIECRVVESDDWCRRCGAEGISRGTVIRKLAHVPFGMRPTTLLVRVRRYRCSGCGRLWRQDTSRAAEPRSKLSRGALSWALHALVVDHLTVARVADHLGVGWHTANTAVLEEGRRRLIEDPHRFDGVAVIGVDEHAWRHTRFGDRYVTVVIDLTPIRDGTGSARLLDMVEGRSKQVFRTWLDAQTPAFRDGIEVVAMDGFTGFKTAAAEALPEAVEVMDPFHVVQLAGDTLDRCRQRVQQDTLGHRGHAGDPLYGIRRALHTGERLLTEKQRARIDVAFAADEQHIAVEVTWAVYQRIVTCYRDPDRAAGRRQLRAVIDALRRDVPAALTELRRLGRTLARRAVDILAYFDLPGTSNGPTEAINGRLEHLRGSALGFRNLTNYIARSLLETGGFRPALHPRLR
jgi:transposase